MTDTVELSKVAERPDDARVLGNAACFLKDKDLGEQLLRKAQALAPNDLRWSRRLVTFLEARACHAATEAERRAHATKLVTALENLLNRVGGEEHYDYWPSLAQAALWAGDSAKASWYATEVLAVEGDPEAGHSTERQRAHVILGKIAVRAGDLEEARCGLLAAARSTGLFREYNISLARELFETGERDGVIEYLELSKKCWRPTDRSPDRLIAEIRRGIMPEEFLEWSSSNP